MRCLRPSRPTLFRTVLPQGRVEGPNGDAEDAGYFPEAPPCVQKLGRFPPVEDPALTADGPATPGPVQPGVLHRRGGPFADEGRFKLGEGGGELVEKPAGGRAGVDGLPERDEVDPQRAELVE